MKAAHPFGCAAFLLISDVMHNRSMFEGSCFGKRLVSLAERDIEGDASEGDAAPRVRGSNTL